MKKVILVIGGSSGIGLSVTNHLNEDEFKIYNISRRNCINKNVYSLCSDVTDNETFVKSINEVIIKEGRIDFLLYSSGYSMAARIDQVKESDYRYLFDVNFFGFLKALTLIIPIMKNQKGGRVIVISSLGGVLPIPFDGYYSASKIAINKLVESLNIELNNENIYLTSIMPGGTRNYFTLKRNVYLNNYNNSNFHNAVLSLAKIEQTGRSNEDVAKTIIKVIRSKRPPILVTSGFINKIYYGLSKVLPLAAIILLTKLKYNIK